jgi:hypothetical protein
MASKPPTIWYFSLLELQVSGYYSELGKNRRKSSQGMHGSSPAICFNPCNRLAKLKLGKEWAKRQMCGIICFSLLEFMSKDANQSEMFSDR